MPTYTGHVVAVVTAHLPSERAFRRHCAQWVGAGCRLRIERWELDQVGVIPDVPPGKLLLHVCTIGNPDHGHYAPVSEPEWHVVATIAEARDKCEAYLKRHAGAIGGGNWGPHSGMVTDNQGAEVAKFSYNLRCFAPSGAELPCPESTPPDTVTKPVKYIVLGPDGVPIRAKPFASRADAERGVAEFVARFRVQGYYAGVGYRLELDEIAARCTVQECSGRRGQG
jgi:hypothetical protein